MLLKQILATSMLLIPVSSFVLPAYADDTHMPDNTMMISRSIYATVPPNGYKYCDAKAAVSPICDGLEHCQFYVDDTLCGDPSPGILKHLSTTFTCGKKAYLNDTAEYGTAILDCDKPEETGSRQIL